VIVRVLGILSVAGLLAACTAGSGGGPSPASSGPAAASGSTGARGIATAPIDSGPTRAAAARSCPFATEGLVRDTMGMRLGRLTVLRSGGHVVGCRFYALQGSPLHDSEHLPGPNQPVVEITTRRYAAPFAAHDAFVLLARKGSNAVQADLGRTVGVCFQAAFYPNDHGTDWACAASVGRTELVVRTVDTTGSFSTATLTRAVLRHV
jgi:hypothetical protein